MTEQTGDARHTLVLVRHAKASSASSGSDRDRPLTDRGRADAAALGAWLRPRAEGVAEVWSSPARRARQTVDEIVARLSDPPPPDFRDAIYDAGPDDLLEMVRGAGAGPGALLVVGHNPTIERLQAWLSGDDRGFPAGAGAVLEFATTWPEIQPGDARLTDFMVP